jgi:hypothetical protein
MNTSRRALSRLWLLAIFLLLTTFAAEAQKGTSVVRRVRFPRGRTTAILRGSVKRGVSHDYLLNARAGQTMTVHLASRGDLSLTVLSPSGEVVADFLRDWSEVLPLSGDYRINVLPDTSTDAPFQYTLEVTIR